MLKLYYSEFHGLSSCFLSNREVFALELYFTVCKVYNSCIKGELRVKMLRVARKEKGLTMKELGEKVGVSESAISQYETGKREADFETLLKIGEVLECSVDYLLRGEGTKKRPAPMDGDGLSQEQLELIRLFGNASPELRAAALAVLRSAEGQNKAQGGASSGK